MYSNLFRLACGLSELVGTSCPVASSRTSPATSPSFTGAMNDSKHDRGKGKSRSSTSRRRVFCVGGLTRTRSSARNGSRNQQSGTVEVGTGSCGSFLLCLCPERPPVASERAVPLFFERLLRELTTNPAQTTV
eukprot:3955462-Pleurochrysis_carterae.AAC.1